MVDNNQSISVTQDDVLFKRTLNAFIRKCIFAVLLFYLAQPVLYIILSQLFYGKIRYFVSGTTTTIIPSYIYWHRPVIFGCAWVLTFFLLVYLVVNIPKRVLSKDNVLYLVKHNIEVFLLGILFVWISIALFFSQDIVRSTDAYKYYLCYPEIFIGVLVLKEKEKKQLLNAFVITGTIISLLVMLKDGFGIVNLKCFHEPQSAIFVNRNYYGYYVALITSITVAMLYKEPKIYLQILYGVTFAINEFALLITLTRGAFLGIVMAIIIMLIVFPIQEKRLSYKILIIPCIFVAVFLLLEYTSITEFSGRVSLLFTDIFKMLHIAEYTEEEAGEIGSGRIAIWRETLRIIASSPIVGVGVDNTTYPHNELLQLAVWSGIPALIIYVVTIVLEYIKLLVNREKLTQTQSIAAIGCAAYIISSFFGVGLPQIIPLFVITLGCMISWQDRCRQEVIESTENTMAINKTNEKLEE